MPFYNINILIQIWLSYRNYCFFSYFQLALLHQLGMTAGRESPQTDDIKGGWRDAFVQKRRDERK